MSAEAPEAILPEKSDNNRKLYFSSQGIEVGNFVNTMADADLEEVSFGVEPQS